MEFRMVVLKFCKHVITKSGVSFSLLAAHFIAPEKNMIKSYVFYQFWKHSLPHILIKIVR